MASTLRNRGILDDLLRAQLLHRNKKVNAALEMTDSWALDIDSIIIQSVWYCWGTCVGCAVLVIGGLAIGLTVNNRIHGVDPFNISVFCWVLAGFIIVFVKSLRVENWPWRDFFLGRVVCRTVSEVTAVSGIDEQLFLSILLRLEAIVIMNKQGPFRAVFKRQDDNAAAGFSIDVPFNRDSLADAGYFFIKVQSSRGPALVAIYALPSASYNVVKPQHYSRGETGLKCRNFREPEKWGRGEHQMPMYGLSTNYLRWSRVIGLYWRDAYFR